MDALRSTFQQTVEDLRKEKVIVIGCSRMIAACVTLLLSCSIQEMLGRQLEYERVRLEAESKKARLESQEKV